MIQPIVTEDPLQMKQ